MSALNIDHFKCYRVERTIGTRPFHEQTVVLEDQFERKTTRVRRPLLYCDAVDKDGHPVHLLPHHRRLRTAGTSTTA